MYSDYPAKYTLEEIAEQCKNAVLRGRVQPGKYVESYEKAAYKQGDCNK